MNHNVGCPFDPAYDSSILSPNKTPMNTFMAIQEEEGVIQAIANNNMMIVCYMYHHNQQVINCWSIPSHIVISHDRKAANHNLFADCFIENPQFNDAMFNRRIPMSRCLFLRIFNAVKAHENYFMEQTDALGKLDLSTLHKAASVFGCSRAKESPRLRIFGKT